MNTDENLKSTWLLIFSRKGALGENTRPWDEYDVTRRARLLTGLHLMSGELPVLASDIATQPRFLLTTRRLIRGATEVPIEHIVEVEPVDFTKRPKRQLSGLRVATAIGKSVRVETEVGPPYVGLWNVLLHIATKNLRNKRG